MEDWEQLWEQAQEGKVSLKEEFTQAQYKLLRLQNLFEHGEITDKFYPGSIMSNASKDDIMLCIAVFSRLLRGVWDGGIRAYGDITSTRAETVQVVGIKAMGDCEMK